MTEGDNMLKRKIIFSVIGVCSVFAVSIGFGVYTKISAQAPEKVDYVCYQGDISALEGVSFNMVGICNLKKRFQILSVMTALA